MKSIGSILFIVISVVAIIALIYYLPSIIVALVLVLGVLTGGHKENRPRKR